MKISWIPKKNSLLDEEKIYLNTMLSKGKVLRKKGNLFYYFDKTEKEFNKDSSINVLLVDCNEEVKKYQVLYEKKYKSLNKKLSYVLSDRNSRWLIEEKYLLKWYQDRQGSTLNYANLFGVVGLLIPILRILPIVIPNFMIWFSPIFISLAILNLVKSDVYFKGSSKIIYELGKLTGFESEYILGFPKTDVRKINGIEQEIKSLGYLKKVSKDTFKLKTPMEREELIETISEISGLPSKDFSVTHIGELYLSNF